MPRSTAHRQGVHHLVVRVLAFNREGEYLVQRRAEKKESCPGFYTDSASGHVSFSLGLLFQPEVVLLGESSRELEEEVGLSPVGGEEGELIRPFSVPRYSPEAFETSHCFVAAVEGEVVTSEEVDPARTGFVGRDRLVEMLGSGKFVPVAREYWWELLREVGEGNPWDVIFGPRDPSAPSPSPPAAHR